MKLTKDKYIQIREHDKETQELKAIARALDIPMTQIAREAIRDKVAELKRTHPRLKNDSAQITTNA